MIQLLRIYRPTFIKISQFRCLLELVNLFLITLVLSVMVFGVIVGVVFVIGFGITTRPMPLFTLYNLETTLFLSLVNDGFQFLDPTTADIIERVNWPQLYGLISLRTSFAPKRPSFQGLVIPWSLTQGLLQGVSH